jgi:IPT/TIG domain-containing protein
MHKACILLFLILLELGCGYSSNGNGTVAPGAPSISQLSPNSMAAGGAGFTLTVMGSNFARGAVIYWNAGARGTSFVSSTQITAAISAGDIATAGTVLVHVTNPGGTGTYMNQPGQSSTTVNFTVTP